MRNEASRPIGLGEDRADGGCARPRADSILALLRRAGEGAHPFLPPPHKKKGVVPMRRIILAVTVSLVVVAMMASASLAATAPAAPVISNPSEGSLVNSFFTLSGTAPTNSVVKVFEVIDGTSKPSYRGDAQVSATGQWELTLSGVADGRHAYKAYATDKATGQNSGWSNTRTVNVDSTLVLRPPVGSRTDWSVVAASN